MHPVHIAGVDLNLALVLHSLIDERSVSRAARRLGLSQSATSHALARLRHLLGDPLFVRSARGLVPTPRAEAIAPALEGALAELERAFFAPPTFDPASTRRRFAIAASDYVELLLGPPLLGRLARVAPGIDVHARPSPDSLAELEAGGLDLALSVSSPSEATSGIRSLPLWKDCFVGVARRDHPILQGKMTLERYVAARHAFIAPRGREGGPVDHALRALGRTRRVAFTTPGFLVAPQIVAGTDLIITMAARIARVYARTLPLELFAPPIHLEPFTIAMFWPARLDADPAHRFLRDEVARAAASLPEEDARPIGRGGPTRGRSRSAPSSLRRRKSS